MRNVYFPPQSIANHLVSLAERLRREGVAVDSGSLLEVSKALDMTHVTSDADLRSVLACVLASNREEAERIRNLGPTGNRIEAVAEQDVAQLSVDGASPTRTTLPGESNLSRPVRPHVTGGPPGSDDADTSKEGDQEVERVGGSDAEMLWEKDFAALDDTELAEAEQLLAEFAWNLVRRRSRRFEPNRRGSLLDLRRSYRHLARHDGEAIALLHKFRRHDPRRIVLLCDVSGSMDRYSRLLLRFVHALHGSARLEVFVFSTRLTRITPDLSHRYASDALQRASSRVTDWSGGTRIGEALLAFNRQWSRRLRLGSSLVLIVSDGWEQGDPDVLAAEIRRLRSLCYRLVWLNPLLGSPDYQPLSMGIRAALPHLDQFLPVHNLNNLKALGAVLEGF